MLLTTRLSRKSYAIISRAYASQAVEDTSNVINAVKDPPGLKRTPHTPPVAGSALRRWGRDLTADALAGHVDPLIGRELEMARMVQILLRRTKNNVLLIGDPGVGKTRLAEGLALLTASPTAPPALRGRSVVSLDVGGLISGTQYRGSFEERLQGVLNDVRVAGGRIFLFIDEIHMLMGAGRVEGGTNAADLLKPALARGELRLVGATTVEEYRKHIEADGAFARRLQPVMVEEPEPEVAAVWLNGLKPRLETFHGVVFASDAVSTAVEAAQKYMSDRRLPDSAIDLLDEAAARVQLGDALRPSSTVSSVAVDSTVLDNTSSSDEIPKSIEEGQQQQIIPPVPPPPPQNGATSQRFRWWLESVSKGRSPEEINDLLRWFGASPEDPLPGFAGHRQTTEARRRWAAQNILGDKTTQQHQKLASDTTTGKSALESGKVGFNATLSCPMCGTATSPGKPGDVTVNCPRCRYKFLNCPPDRLMLGASLFAEQRQQKADRERRIAEQEAVLAKLQKDKEEEEAQRQQSIALEQTTPPLQQAANYPIVTGKDILTVAAEAANIPLEHVLQSRNSALMQLQPKLQQEVCGQLPAINAVVRAVRLGFALGTGAQKRRRRPLASLLLTGPVGTGKSTLCRALAEHLFGSHRSFLRIDLSNCGDRTAVSRLIGAPPGYVGYGDGGELTDAVRRRPHSVVYLESADSAHPEVLALISEILKEGELKDSQGRLANFRNAIVVLTTTASNNGSTSSASGSSSNNEKGSGDSGATTTTTTVQEHDDPHLGGGPTEVGQPLRSGHMAAALPTEGIDSTNAYKSASAGHAAKKPRRRTITEVFPAELLGLVDSTADFSALSVAELRGLAARMVEESEDSLTAIAADGAAHLTISNEAVEWLAREAHKSGGARKLHALVRDQVLAPVVDAVLQGGEGKLEYYIDVGANGLVIT